MFVSSGIKAARGTKTRRAAEGGAARRVAREEGAGAAKEVRVQIITAISITQFCL